MNKELVNFETIGKKGLKSMANLDFNGSQLNDAILDNLNDIEIPTDLPSLDQNAIDGMDAMKIKPILNCLLNLIKEVPKFPARPAIDFDDDKDLMLSIQKAMEDFNTLNSLHKRQMNKLNTEDHQEKMSNLIEKSMEKLLSQPSPYPQYHHSPYLYCYPPPPPFHPYYNQQPPFTQPQTSPPPTSSPPTS